jgi:hypothetical protein
VGRDQNVTSGAGGEVAKELVVLNQLLKKVGKQIDRLDKDDDEKDELKDRVDKIKDEAKKGDEANAGKVERWLRNIAEISDDILDVVTAALLNPAAGVAEVIKKVAQKARETKA